MKLRASVWPCITFNGSAAGRVEGVSRGHVDDEELKLEAGWRQVTNQPGSDFSHVSEQLFILNEARVAGHALVVQLAENHLLLGRKDVVEM